MGAERGIRLIQPHQFSDLMRRVSTKLNIHFASGGKALDDDLAFKSNGVLPIIVEHGARMTRFLGMGDWMDKFETSRCRESLVGYLVEFEPLGAADGLMASVLCTHALRDIRFSMDNEPELADYRSKSLRGENRYDVEGVLLCMRMRHGMDFMPQPVRPTPEPFRPSSSSSAPGMG